MNDTPATHFEIEYTLGPGVDRWTPEAARAVVLADSNGPLAVLVTDWDMPLADWERLITQIENECLSGDDDDEEAMDRVRAWLIKNRSTVQTLVAYTFTRNTSRSKRASVRPNDRCPFCGEQMDVYSEDYAGEQIACQHCQNAPYWCPLCGFVAQECEHLVELERSIEGSSPQSNAVAGK